ncbi:SAF domain-containing protein [Nakamurella deserti]|uniref:SAF domain-containing protein n=1 Tax=Nakamurella deserti TaxID=2164074 RepID=UPI00130081AD|nr:SAF domain-containing protein [Nakamurella deserti]
MAVLLLVLAGLSAARGSAAEPGVEALALTRDLKVGAVLTATDVAVTRVVSPPDGALADPADVDGRRLTSAARRGEVLTDRRLVDTPGPEPGPGRAAVAVRPADPAVLQLLQAGSAVVVVGIDSAGAVQPLTSDALVLAVLVAGSGSGDRSQPVLLSVPEAEADRLAAAALTGDVALRLR